MQFCGGGCPEHYECLVAPRAPLPLMQDHLSLRQQKLSADIAKCWARAATRGCEPLIFSHGLKEKRHEFKTEASEPCRPLFALCLNLLLTALRAQWGVDEPVHVIVGHAGQA